MREQNHFNINKSLTVEDAILEQISATAAFLEANGRDGLTRNYYHHGSTTIYEHCWNAAFTSCIIANKFHLCVNYDWLIRGALLHDYYLYDWHAKEKEHMYPLTIAPPMTMKGRLVCIADKICAVNEIRKGEKG